MRIESPSDTWEGDVRVVCGDASRQFKLIRRNGSITRKITAFLFMP
jgi:hypothetical protein